MKSLPWNGLSVLEPVGRVGVAGANFRRMLTYLVSNLFSSARIILLDLNDEFSCVARIEETKHCNVAKYSINPVKPPCPDGFEKYVEALVEILDYCFGVFNMKNIVAKAVLNNLSASLETTIPEIASKLDFETPEGGLSLYTPFEPFTFGTMRNVFGRKEMVDFNRVLETGVVFDFSGLATAASKAFASLMVMNKLARLEPRRRTAIVLTYPSLVWPKNRRRDNAQLFAEGVLLEELERRGYSVIIAEKSLSEVSERVIQSLDSIVFSPSFEALGPENPWRISVKHEPSILNSPALIVTRKGDVECLKPHANIFIKPLSKEEREKHKPALNSFSKENMLREDLGEDYEAAAKVVSRLRELGGRAGLNRIVDEIRLTVGAGGLRALATLLRQGCLKQVQEEGETLLVLLEGELE